MIAALAHNICSPLGWSSSENFSAVIAGRSALMLHTGKWGLPDAFTASHICIFVIAGQCACFAAKNPLHSPACKIKLIYGRLVTHGNQQFIYFVICI